jgi:hypothetical protein
MAEDKRTYYGVYHRDGDGEPVAVFTDGDAAQTWRKARPDGEQMMVTETDGLDRHADIADHFEALRASEQPAPAFTADPAEVQEEMLRNQIRAEELDRRKREQLRAEVNEELDAQEQEERAQDKPQSRRSRRRSPEPTELREPATVGAEPDPDPERAARGAGDEPDPPREPAE